jgi:hypothetical protein
VAWTTIPLITLSGEQLLARIFLFLIVFWDANNQNLWLVTQVQNRRHARGSPPSHARRITATSIWEHWALSRFLAGKGCAMLLQNLTTTTSGNVNAS